MNRFETLILETGVTSAALATPGSVLQALALGAGLRANDVGMMHPVSRGRVNVEITSVRAWSIPTPVALPVGDAVFNLRRDTDLPLAAPTRLQLGWAGAAPTPGALAAALSQATEGQLGAEELGAGFATPTSVQVEVPPYWANTLAALGSLELDGAKVSIGLVGVASA
ncbi:MAG: hypothetical protein ACI9MR_002841 [Myxococcota bacterium]|jgi:hypothetical protein